MDHFSPFRAASLFVVLVAVLCGLVGRVAYLETYGRQQTIRQADRQQHQMMTLRARPGSIFDTNGIMMAGSIQTETLYCDPKFMQECYQTDGRTLADMDDDVTKLAHILDKDPLEISQLLSDKATSRFVKLAETLDDPTVQRINALKMPGLGMIPVDVRYYPMGSIAAHILGGRGKDGVGLDGLELKYDPTLTGKPGYARVLKDSRRRTISVAAEDYVPPQHGQHLMLTIDANIQMIAEQELAESCEKVKAKRGEVVVMNPETGDILALANYPTFNPQNMEDSTAELRTNKAINWPYEPGSTIKPFIMTPALAWHMTRLDEMWPVNGHYVTPYGRKVTDVHAYPALCTWDVLVKSSNIGMSMLGERMGNPNLFKAITSFNFGRQTGIELPGEDPGRVSPLRKWTKYSTESISQGYELMVTPLQLARGMCAISNGGRLVSPHIVKGVLDENGDLVPAVRKSTGPDPIVVDPLAAAEIRRVLCDVPIRGTARGNQSDTWNLYGKTGTAHISGGKDGYNDQRYTSSFIGGAPFEHPKLVIAFIIHEPDRSIAYYGGAVSAPGATHVLTRSLAYLQVPASPDLTLPAPNIANVLWSYNAKEYDRKAKPEVASAKE